MVKTKKLHVHFMGIGGSGISAVARIARSLNYTVSGCDLEESRTTKELQKEGFSIKIGHDATHLKGSDLLIHTPAVFYQSNTEEEYTLALKKKIAMTWEEFMAKNLHKKKFVIALAGTHGKGTTSAMLSVILEKAGLDPTCEIGVGLLDWGKKNYRLGNSKYFLCEADEFRDKFLLYKPSLAVITSIEMDHPEYFKDLDQIVESFAKFVMRLEGPKTLVINGENEGCTRLLKKLRSHNWSGKIIRYSAISKRLVKLKLPGQHMLEDAGAAWTAAKALGVAEKTIKEGLESFSGCERRFEFKGEMSGVRIYDDYAHHPTAIIHNIKAARELYPKKKIWVVFQPHMYSRLDKLFDDFAKSLRLADRVIVADVFTRREFGVNKPSGKDLAMVIGGPKATYVGGDLTNVANFIARNTKKTDIVLVMGAGDIYKVSDQLLSLDSK